MNWTVLLHLYLVMHEMRVLLHKEGAALFIARHPRALAPTHPQLAPPPLVSACTIHAEILYVFWRALRVHGTWIMKGFSVMLGEGCKEKCTLLIMHQCWVCVCDVCGLGGGGDGEWWYLKLLEMWVLGWSLLLPSNVLLMQQSVQVWLRISLINSFIC